MIWRGDGIERRYTTTFDHGKDICRDKDVVDAFVASSICGTAVVAMKVLDGIN